MKQNHRNSARNVNRYRPSLQELERREVPAGLLVTGTPEGFGPVVTVQELTSGAIVRQFFAFDESFRGGVHVATGDVNCDGVPDIIATPGKGGGPIVRIFDGVTNGLLQEYEVFEDSYRGGVTLAVADVDGDLYADVIVAPQIGSSRVRVVSGQSGWEIANFFAYEETFVGGVYVAAADVTGNGQAEIITGPGNTGGPLVRIFNRNGAVISGFFAFEESWRGGVRVAAVDINSGGIAKIVTGSGIGGGPVVRVFDPHGKELASTFAFDEASRNGVWVATGLMLDRQTPTIFAASNGQSLLLDARTLLPVPFNLSLEQTPGSHGWANGQAMTNQLAFSQTTQAISFGLTPVGFVPGDVAFVGTTKRGAIVRLYNSVGMLIRESVADLNGGFNLNVNGLQHGQSYIFEIQANQRTLDKRQFIYNEWSVEDQRTRNRLLADIPQLFDHTLSDFARVNLIREWANRNFMVAPKELQRYDLAEKPISYLLHEVIDRHSTGFFCGGISMMLERVYGAFGYSAISYNHGVANTAFTHVTTLVNISHRGQRIWVVQDATLNFTITSTSNDPLDVRDLLYALVTNNASAFKIVEGPADDKSKYLFAADPLQGPTPRPGFTSVYTFKFVNSDGHWVYEGYRSLSEYSALFPSFIDELERRGRLPDMISLMVFPLNFSPPMKLSEINSHKQLVSDLLWIVNGVTW